MPRTVDPAREVVLVTGGASGLGLLIAQMYGMKGASVAVLDIKDIGEEECEEFFGVGVRYYRGDVGDRLVLESVRERIVEEVGLPNYFVDITCAFEGFKRSLFHSANAGYSLELPLSSSTALRLGSMASHCWIYQLMLSRRRCARISLQPSTSTRSSCRA